MEALCIECQSQLETKRHSPPRLRRGCYGQGGHSRGGASCWRSNHPALACAALPLLNQGGEFFLRLNMVK